jgi:hypothetical protein
MSRAACRKARCTTNERRRVSPAPGSRSPGSAPRHAHGKRSGDGAGRGFASRPRPPTDQPRTPLWAARPKIRESRFSLRDFLHDAAARERAHGTMIGHGRARSGGKVRAALAAPAPDHRAARAVPHPEPEAVLLLPFPIVRLVCPFHAWPPRTPRPRWGPGAGARHGRCSRAQVNPRVYGLTTNSSNPPPRKTLRHAITRARYHPSGTTGSSVTCWHTRSRGGSVPLPRRTGRPPPFGASPGPRRPEIRGGANRTAQEQPRP